MQSTCRTLVKRLIQPIVRPVFRHSHTLVVVIVCGLAAVSCDKQSGSDLASGSNDGAGASIASESNLVNAASGTTDQSLNKAATDTMTGTMTDPVTGKDATPTAPPALIECNDQLALTQLIQMMRANVKNQAKRRLNDYLDSTHVPTGLASTDASVGAMLVDIANPEAISAPNANGMLTCHASLSLTLPSKDVYRTIEIYNALEKGALNRRLQAQKILLNNNMLVSNTFTYVVGLRNGQTLTRMVGEPAILKAGADIIAKSQFKVAVEAAAQSSVDAIPAQRPAQPTQSAQPTQPSAPAMPAHSSPAHSSNGNKPNNDNSNAKNNNGRTVVPDAASATPSNSATRAAEAALGRLGKDKRNNLAIAEDNNNLDASPNPNANSGDNGSSSDDNSDSNSNNNKVAPMAKANSLKPKPTAQAGNNASDGSQLHRLSDDKIDMVIIEEGDTY